MRIEEKVQEKAEQPTDKQLTKIRSTKLSQASIGDVALFLFQAGAASALRSIITYRYPIPCPLILI